MQELETVQAAILEIVRAQYAPTVFELWFGDISLISLDTREAVWGVNNDFKQGVIMEHYTKTLEEAAEKVLGFHVNIRVILKPGEAVYMVKPFKTVQISNLTEEEKVQQEEEQNIETDLESNTIFTQFTFENFIVGASNNFAHAACYNIAKEPGQNYNPLFLYGQSGVGKTHLLYAITNEIKKNLPSVRIVYKKGDEFTNEMIAAIKNGTMETFRARYRTADVLLIDDIHFIAGRESTQEEFFHTFNALHDADKQIILTSDRPPKDIKTLEERLRTRFEWGVIVDIQPPDEELRIAIIRQKAESLGIVIPDDAVFYMAQKLKNSVRTIEGAIKKIRAVSVLTRTPITLDLCKSALVAFTTTEKSEETTIEKIFDIVSHRYNVPEDEIRGKKRNDAIAKARHLCIYLIRQLTELSLADIGKLFSRDHTTIIASINYMKGQIETVSGMEGEVNDIISTIQL